jgi:cytochrome b
LHEGSANLMLGLVFVHVLAVVVSGWLHGENLIRAMVTGRKQGAAEEGIRRSWRPLGALVLAAVLGFWGLQWSTAPTERATTAQANGHDDD